jgi:zinc transport system substrate-binding protein
MHKPFQIFILCVLYLGCGMASATDKIKVAAVNYPLAYFAQRIGIEHVEVEFPLPRDVDPAFWRPDAGDVAGLQQADLILLNGAGYSKWLTRVSLPQRKLVNTSAGFVDDYIHVKQASTHQHGPAGEHSHEGVAFTTWLDFNQSVQQARTILQAFEKHRPGLAASFRKNFDALNKDLEHLDRALMNIVANDPDKSFIASHPVYQYLARRYGIKLESVMWEADTVPDEAQWHAIQQLLGEHQASWMIWEARPDPDSVARLQTMGVSSLVFDPAANMPQQGDFLTVMKNNLEALEAAYR